MFLLDRRRGRREYNLTYERLPYCGQTGSLGDLFGHAQAPDKDYFLAVGLKKSYGAITAAHPQGAAIEAATGNKLLNAVGVGGLAGALSGAAVLAGITSALIAANVASIFPYAGALLFAAESGSFLSAGALGAAGFGFVQIAAAGGPAVGDTLDKSTEIRVPLTLSGPTLFGPGDTLSSQVLIRRGSGSGNTDATMWYGSAAGLKGSTHFDATFGGVSVPVHYTGAACGVAKGSAPPCSRPLNQAAGSGAVTAVQQAGKDFVSFGNWLMVIGTS